MLVEMQVSRFTLKRIPASFWILFFLAVAHSLPIPSSQKQVPNVVDRKLVKETTTYRSILNEHKRYSTDTESRYFDNPVLAYVTPWNSHGYDMAKLFNHKFTYVSPVWYQIRFDRGERRIFLTGQHDVDQGWITDVRNVTSPDDPDILLPNIVPRFIFDGWTLDDYHFLFNDETHALSNSLISLLLRECVRQNYDGLVLEHGYIINNQMAPLLISLANQLHELNKKIILVIPADKGIGLPNRDGGHTTTLTSSTFVWLAEYIDHFSLMTYDYSAPGRAGPTAPLSWMTQNVLRLLPPDYRGSRGFSVTGKDTFPTPTVGTGALGIQSGSTTNSFLGRKILMGICFYGYEFSADGKFAEAVIGSKYLKMLAAYKPKIVWNSAHHEHYFTYHSSAGKELLSNNESGDSEEKTKEASGEERTVYYPTVKSVADRVALARDLGVGVSVWEIGQGLDYFFDLL